ELNDVKSQILEELGKIGQGLGEFAGELRNEHEFGELIAEFTQNYEGAVKKYYALEAKISANDDSARYKEEMDTLRQVLEDPRGIYVAVISNGEMKPEYRMAFPELCRKNIADIRKAQRDAHK